MDATSMFGNQAQVAGLPDGWWCGSVFAEADGIVGEDEDGVDFHQRRHAQGVAFVFAEHQGKSRRRVSRRHAQGKAVQLMGTHAELAHTVVDGLPPLSRVIETLPDQSVRLDGVSRLNRPPVRAAL